MEVILKPDDILSDHDKGVLEDIDAMAKDHQYGWWSRALANSTRRIINALVKRNEQQQAQIDKLVEAIKETLKHCGAKGKGQLHKALNQYQENKDG